MYYVSSKFMQISSIQEVTCVTCIFQVKTLFTSQPFWQSLLPEPCVQAEHFDAEHSHDKFESHGTKNAGALPDKVQFFLVAGLKKHFSPPNVRRYLED